MEKTEVISAKRHKPKPITLKLRTCPNHYQVNIYNLSMDKKVSDLKTLASEKVNLPCDRLELIWCGNILEDDATLKSCGLMPGVHVNVLKKSAKEPPRPVQTMSESDIHALVVAFRTLMLNPSYKIALQKLSRPDILDNIIMITPGLSQDPVAISMIQDPELLVRMGDIETVRRIMDVHPALAQAANHIAAAAHEEAIASASSGSLPSTSSGYSNVLDVLSDDDDMESSQSSDSLPQSNNTQQYSVPQPQITAAQVAAALASASAAQGDSNTAPNSEVTTPSSGRITQEVFFEAIRNAMAYVSYSTPTAPSPTVASSTAQLPPLLEVSDPEVEEYMDTENSSIANAAVSGGNFLEQMQQMRELGLLDDAVNLQALQLSGGNVHAAVDLVFSGTISNTQ